MAIPAVTAPTAESAKRFTAFSAQVVATNTPTSYAASGLPTGLSLNTSTGAITGTPTAPAGIYVVILTATNGDGTSPDFNLTITLSSAGLFKTLISGWMENNYLYAILCQLQILTGGGGGASGSGAPAVPGSALGVTTAPVVVAAGMNAVAISIIAGNVVATGLGTEFGTGFGPGSYGWTAPAPGYVLPEITFTGDASADYVVTWMHL